MRNIFLKWQLRRSGAKTEEAKELVKIASQLKDTVPHLDRQAKKAIAHDVGFKAHRTSNRLRYATAFGLSLLLVVLTVIAQSAQPGSLLYALKRGSEEVRVIVQPGFDEDDLEKRRRDEQRRIEDAREDAQKEAEDAAEDRQKALEDARKDAEDAREDAQKEAEDAAKDRQKALEDAREDSSGHGSSGSDSD